MKCNNWLKWVTINVPIHKETSQFIYIANALTGFYMSGPLVVNGLTSCIIFSTGEKSKQLTKTSDAIWFQLF